VLCAVITLLLAWQHLPLPALIGLFFTVSFMSGISTVAGSKAMSEVSRAQSGTASALMGTLMFVCGGIAAPLAGLGGETMLKMSLAMTISYLIALFFGLQKPPDPLRTNAVIKYSKFITASLPDLPANLLLSVEC
jgi:DHA1 family bicyclomycin/chloramphenicol resistance-like MFS transporter